MIKYLDNTRVISILELYQLLRMEPIGKMKLTLMNKIILIIRN